MKNRKGIALIMAVGILALLAVIATSFALNMRLEYKAAMNYYNSVKARHLGEMALQRAIAELKAHVRSSAFDYFGEDWVGSSASYISDIDGNTASSYIKDEQRKVNLNNATSALIGWTLFQFGSDFVAIGSTLANVYAKLNTGATYSNLQELKSVAGLTDAEFNIIKDYVTVSSYVDPHTGRSPVNINTAEREVLSGLLTSAQGDPLAQPIYDRVRGLGAYIGAADPFESWNEFNTFVDSNISPTLAPFVKNNCNPNRITNKVTTEFCFNSGGVYEIKGVGEVIDPSGSTVKTVTAIVRIYGIYNATEKGDFENPHVAGGVFERVTWLDSCPVASGDLFGSYSIPSNATAIPGSIKLGFWDNFNATSDTDDIHEGDRAYSTATWDDVSGTLTFTNADTADSDDELTDVNTYSYGKYIPYNGMTGWTWGDFSLRAFAYDTENRSGMQMKEVSQIFFRGTTLGSPEAVHTRVGPLSRTTNYWAYDTGYGVIDFYTTTEASGLGYTTRHTYTPGQIRIWPDTDHDRDDATPSDRTLLTYAGADKKAYNILATGSTVAVDVYTSAGSGTYSRSNIATSTGGIALYGHYLKVAWDDIRIIPPHGNYTSRTIDSSVISGLPADFVWGTITGTISQSEDLKTTPSSANYGDIMFQTSLTGGFSTDSNSDGVPDSDGKSRVSLTASQPYLALNTPSSTSSSIQYKAWLTNGADLKETPIFEDITITYIPATEILSYTVSQ